MPHINNDIGHALARSAQMVVKENTPEEKRRVMAVICGSDHCKGPEDAAILLEALGLLEQKAS